MTDSVEHAARAHAVYAPSSAHRWSVCTASAEAIAVLPEQEEGEAAREGTEAHEEIERCLGPWKYTDGTRSLHYDVDPDHPAAYGVSLLLSYVRQLPPGRLWIEQRVELTPYIWGSCDVAHFDDASGTLTIVDYKNGYVDVAVEENEQLMIYAAASIYTHNLSVKWIRLVVIQPNTFIPGVPKVKQWVTSADALFEFAKRVADIPTGPKEFVAGEHCRYCPLFSKCQPTIDLLAHLSVALQHSPEEVTPTQRAQFMTLKRPIEDWFKSADKKWTADALKAGAPEGMKIVTATTRRAWKDEAAAKAAVLAKFGPEGLEAPTPAAAEKMGLDVSDLTTTPDGAPVLAFASDKRREWTRKSAAEMFKDVAK